MPPDDTPFERLPISDRIFDEEAVRIYAAITDDYNPIHCDATFAATTEFGCTIVHGTLVSAPLWQHLSDRLAEGGAYEVRFIRPTPVGAKVGYWRRGAAESRDFVARLNDGTIVMSMMELPA